MKASAGRGCRAPAVRARVTPGAIIVPVITCVVICALAACGKAPPPSADLVLRDGKIVTLDPATGVTEGVAISGYRIIAAGDQPTIDAYIGPDTRIIELDGRLAIPGFIEGHGHFMDLGRARRILDLNDAASWQEVLARVAAAVEKAEPGTWILGRGWHQEKWREPPQPSLDGLPLNDALNALTPDNPVYLGHASGHAAFANAAALAAAGIDGDTTDPDGGTIVRTAGGRATGLLRENAQNLVEQAIARYQAGRPQEAIEAIQREQARLAAEEALRFGVTSFQDAGSSFAVIDFLRRLEAESALPVRLYVMVGGESNADLAERAPDYFMPAQGDDFLTVRAFKRQIDGALGAHGAWLLAPYEDMADSTGLVLESVQVIERTAEIALEHGFQVGTHAIGDRANREVLNLYERAWRRAGLEGADLRWRIEHAQHIHHDDVPRFGQLGVIAAVQGIHCTSDGPWVPARLGAERAARTSYPWRDLLDSGAVLNNGTDTPVEPIDPIASFYASVSRKMANGRRFHPGQAMTRQEALRSYTLDNAYSAFEEHLKGSLAPGKYADIAVLSQDILTVPEADIPATRVDYTIVGGEIRYAR